MSGTRVREPGSETRGIVLAFATLGGGEGWFAALGPGERERAQSTWRLLQSLDGRERAQRLEGWRTEAERGVPAGLERLHPSWILAALAGEPAHVLACARLALPEAFHALVDGLSAQAGGSTDGGASFGLCEGAAHPAPSVRAGPVAEVARVGFGGLARLCDGDCGPLANQLCALSFNELEDEVMRIGARVLAHALATAAPPLRAHALATAGEPWASVMREAFTEAVAGEERKRALDCAAASVEPAACTPSDRLLHIGLAALRSRLAAEHPGSQARVAGRLRAPLGQRLL